MDNKLGIISKVNKGKGVESPDKFSITEFKEKLKYESSNLILSQF